jgi:hypothetical protein
MISVRVRATTGRSQKNRLPPCGWLASVFFDGLSKSRGPDGKPTLTWAPGVIDVKQPGSLNANVCIATLSLAMGLMNTTLSQVSAEPVSLTFVTGTLNTIGLHLALAVRRAPLPDTQGQWDTHLGRAGLMASVWAGFLARAMVSAAATSYFGVWILLPPVLILLALALERVPLAAENVPTEQPAQSTLTMNPTTAATEPREVAS